MGEIRIYVAKIDTSVSFVNALTKRCPTLVSVRHLCWEDSILIDAKPNDLTVEELEVQHAAELPERELLITVTLLGIPIIGLSGINVSIS